MKVSNRFLSGVVFLFAVLMLIVSSAAMAADKKMLETIKPNVIKETPATPPVDLEVAQVSVNDSTDPQVRVSGGVNVKLGCAWKRTGYKEFNWKLRFFVDGVNVYEKQMSNYRPGYTEFFSGYAPPAGKHTFKCTVNDEDVNNEPRRDNNSMEMSFNASHLIFKTCPGVLTLIPIYDIDKLKAQIDKDAVFLRQPYLNAAVVKDSNANGDIYDADSFICNYQNVGYKVPCKDAVKLQSASGQGAQFACSP